MKYLFFALRPRQWIKNLFIFLPLIFGKKLYIFPENLKVTFSFLIFCLASSSVYLVNDIMDLKSDRLHPEKHLRPLASGKISLKQALIGAFTLGVFSILLSFSLNLYFGWIIATYLIFNFIYTKALKEAVIIDAFCIAFFFLLRIFSGAVVARVEISYWIVFMTGFLALFIGFNKRRYELKLFEKEAEKHRFVLTKYSLNFIDQMNAVITTSIVISYMLYTVTPRTIGEFGTNHLIYTIPFVYYGIFRYLYLVHRWGKGGDPTCILLSDKKMQLNLALWIIVCIAVIYFGL